MRRLILLLTLVMLAASCGSKAPTSTGSPNGTSPTPSVTPSASPLAPLVGQWEMNKTCQAMVSTLTKAGLQNLIPGEISGTIKGWPQEAPVPAWWDPSHPCAHATLAPEHSHTFWADGTFNSYDENGNEVDNDHYELADNHTFRFKYITMHYSVAGDSLKMNVVIPPNCTAKRIVGVDDEGHPVRCRDLLGWAFSVAWPGQVWTRVTSGPHVPPGTGSSG
jgi:hypothetical protein